MNLKIAHLVSIQFGIFIGVVICLVFFRFESFRSHPAAAMRKPVTERATTAQSKSEPEDQASDTEDDATAPEEVDRFAYQSAPPLPNEYSPEAVEKSMAILTKLYYEQISPRRNTSSTAAEVAPSYTEVAQKPQAVQAEEPAPQTIAYPQATQVIVYSQPAPFIIFSQPRRFLNRHRPALQAGAFPSNSHRRHDNGGTHGGSLPGFESPASPSTSLRCPPRSLAVAHRENPGVPKR